MSKFKINVFAATNVGRVREHNEDFVGFHKPTHKEREEEYGTIMVVADGVGGSAKGEVASRIAVEQTIRNYYNLPKSLSPDKRLKKAIELANSAVIKKAREIGAEGMATTLTAAVVINDTAFIANVGDSRTYIINPNRPEKIKQITLDHSLVEEQVRRGLLTKEEAERAPNKNVITRAIGMDSFVSVDLFKVKLMEGDKLLLCSDGLVKVVRDKEIYRIVSTRKNIEESVNTLIKLANARGGPDNITVCIGEVRKAKKASALVPVLTGVVAIALILLMALPIFPPTNTVKKRFPKGFTPNQIYFSSTVINSSDESTNSEDSNTIIVIEAGPKNMAKKLNINPKNGSLSFSDFPIKIENLKFYIDAKDKAHFDSTTKNNVSNVDNVSEIQFLYHITGEYLALTKDSKLEIIKSDSSKEPELVEIIPKQEIIAFAVQDPSTIYVLNANGQIWQGSLEDAKENAALTLEDKLGELQNKKVSLFSKIINSHHKNNQFYINEPITDIQSMLADNTTGNLYLLGHEYIYELPGILNSVNIKVVNNASSTSHGSLSISSSPQGAEIYIDGKDIGKQTPQAINNIEAGKHTITLKKQNYKTFSGPFTITKGNTKTINATLIPVSSNVDKNNNANKLATTTLSISSDPSGAEIYIDNKDTRKQTPQTMKLSKGKHTITLKKQNYKTYSTAITFENGKEYQVIASLTPISENKETTPKVTTATLSISSSPQGAEVYIDGKDTGKQTPQKFTLPQGKHTIELWRRGYEKYVVSLNLLPGKLHNLNKILTESPPLLSVSSTPEGAEIYIDNKDTNHVTPFSFWIIASGKHTVKLELRGYKDYTTSVTVKDGSTAPVSATLKQSTQNISINSNPSGAEVYIDGKDTGKQTSAIVELSYGKHTIKLTKKDYKDSSKTINVPFDKPTPDKPSLNFNLEYLYLDSLTFTFKFNVADEAYKGIKDTFLLDFKNSEAILTPLENNNGGKEHRSSTITQKPKKQKDTLTFTASFNAKNTKIKKGKYKLSFFEKNGIKNAAIYCYCKPADAYNVIDIEKENKDFSHYGVLAVYCENPDHFKNLRINSDKISNKIYKYNFVLLQRGSTYSVSLESASNSNQLVSENNIAINPQEIKVVELLQATNSSSAPISLSLPNSIKNLFSIPNASADTGFTFQKNIPLVDKIVTISKEGHSFNVGMSGNLKIQTTASVSSAPSNKKVNVGDTVPLEVSPKFSPVNFTLNLAFNLNGNTIKKTVSAVMSSPFQKTLSFNPVVVSGGGLLNPTIKLKPKIIFSKSTALFALEQTGNASLDKNILTFSSSSPQTVNVSINKRGSSEVLLTSPNLKFSFDRISLAGNASITVLGKKIPISLPDISVSLSGSTTVSGTPQQVSLAQFSTNFAPLHSTPKPGQNLPSRLPFSKSNLLWILLSLVAGGTVILLVSLLTANRHAPNAAISRNSANRMQRLPYASAYLLTNGKNVPLFAARPLITIGRSQANTIPLKDSYASNRHAQIIFQKGIWYIKDMGSRNGVYVNNKKINKVAPLHHGDSIKIGHTMFKFVQNLSNKYSHRPHSERRM